MAAIKTLGIVGAGQLGLGIAYVAAKVAKIPIVLLADRSPVELDKAMAFFDLLLTKDVKKGKMTSEEAEAARARIQTVSGPKDFSKVDLVVEVIDF